MRGGQLDVDVLIEGPDKNAIYKEYRKEYDTVTFNSTVSCCFSHNFLNISEEIHYSISVAGFESTFFSLPTNYRPSISYSKNSQKDTFH